MESVARVVRGFVEVLLRPLDALAPWASLAVLAAVTALGMLVVIRRTSPQRLVERSRARMAACIYEMRLYLDHPGRVLAAQGRMIVWTVVYLACLLPSVLLLAAPLGLLYLHLEVRHGFAPLPAPTTVVMRVELDAHVATRAVTVEGDDGLAVTGMVRADDEHAVYARLAIQRPGTHRAVVHVGGASVTKEIAAEPGAPVVSPERRGGLASLWAFGIEPPPETDAIRAITLEHPARDTDLPLPWWLYWLGLATVFALALKRRFDVAL